MASFGQTGLQQCPLVRTSSVSRPPRRDSVLEQERRGRVQLKLITPVAHGEVRNGPGSSALTKTSLSSCSTRLSSIWSHECTGDQDDDLYNLTDDESIVVPLAASASVKKQAAQAKSRYPALIIPPLKDWPSPPKSLKQTKTTLEAASMTKQEPTRAPIFNKSRPLKRVPSRASTPSLDGSLTSEELASSSCPSTPEMLSYSPKAEEWNAPAQLDAEAYAVLCQLAVKSGRTSNNSSPDRSPQIPQEAFAEMREIARECAGRLQRRSLAAGDLVVPRLSTSSEPVSALTVPSPSTFFGSLHPSMRQTWCVGGTPPPPSTGTAERFYKLPWRGDSPLTERKPTHEIRPTAARKDSVFTIFEEIEATEITESAFLTSSQQVDNTEERTKRWLQSQCAWMASEFVEAEDRLKSCFSPETPTPSTPKTTVSLPDHLENTPSSKKSVRFLDSVPEVEEPKENASVTEPLFLEGFCYAATRSRTRDTFLHSQARAEASHMLSSTRPSRYSAQLRGEFEIEKLKLHAPSRPISILGQAQADDEEFKEIVASAERERQALEQVMPSVWELHASRQVFGSRLIATSIAEQLKSRNNMRILDYGGGVSCDWAWAVALKYPTSTVFTVPTSPVEAVRPLRGPANHSVVRANSPISLPFPDNHFDLVSARSLHTMLHTRFPDSAKHRDDEYDLVLHEFMRVLKPGGFLEFHLMDAELLQPGPLGASLGAEFAATLRQRNYDPQAARYFLPRLRNAGFADVKRAWLVLPAADVVPTWVDRGKSLAASSGCPTPATGRTWAPRHGKKDSVVSAFDATSPAENLPALPVVGSTESVRAMTGLVGARAWERWIVTLQRETGGEEEAMLERVNRALEEGGRVGAGWKCLVGWARKGGGE